MTETKQRKSGSRSRWSALLALLVAAPGFAGVYEVLYAASGAQGFPRNKGYLGVHPKGQGIPRECAVIGTLTVRASLRSDVLRTARLEAWKRGGDALAEVQVGETRIRRLKYGQEVQRKELQAKALVLRYRSRDTVDSLLVGRLLRGRKEGS